MMSTILSVFNGEVIESRVDVPVTLHSPFREKRASSSANQIITSPLAPITPDKGLNMLVDVPVAILSPFTERTASSSAIQIIASSLVPKTPDKGSNPVEDVRVALHSPFSGKTASSSTNLIYASPSFPVTLDKGSNPVAPAMPGTDTSSQNYQLHETTKLPGEWLADGNIQENCMAKKVPFQHAKVSFEGVCPRCLESERDEVEDEVTQGIDLNKIPRKKAEMKKKHRPKVIHEVKPIKSPSPATPKAAENNERPIPKRTYVRKNKSLNSSGTSICITEENKVKLIPMKTYVRKRKALNSSESLSGRLGGTMGLCSSTALKPINQLAINASKSVRRRLDFSAEGEAADGCHVSTASDVKVAAGEAFNGHTTVGSREFTQGLIAVTTKLPAEVTFDLNCSPNQVLDENPTPSAQLSGTEVVRKHEVVSDSSMVENAMIMQSDQEQFESGSHSDIVTRDDDIEKTGTKRAHGQIDQHYSKKFTRDIRFVHGYNGTNKTSLCQETSGLIPYLPVVYKRRRTERGQTWRCNSAFLPKLSKCFTIADAQWSATFDRLQQSKLMLAFDLSQRVTRKRSKLHTRARKPTPIADAEDCTHLLWSPERTKGSLVMPENNKYEPQTCMDALFADTRFKITTKKRRKKGYVRLVSSMLCDMEQECEVASSRFGFLGQPFVPQAVVPYMDPTEFLLDKMKHMKIGGEHIKAIAESSNALMPYGGGSMMIPYGLLFDTIKKQRPRAKVDLDPETNRVWNLLMGGKSDDRTDGVDMDKEKWWEEERHVFRGRTDAFIARMHLIQGDRRFSKWNGSIVDSVVGAFLTQNVSDHLSSSAFMSLAARFPHRSRGNSKEANAEKMDTSKEQGDGSIPASGETITCQEKLSIPETTPGSTGAYKEEKEASDVSSSRKSISHEPSLVYDEQLVEVPPKEIDIDFSAEEAHMEVEILTERQHCGKQTEFPSSSIDFRFNLENEACSSENEQPERKKGISRAKKVNSETKRMFDWEGLREEAFANGAKNERSSDTMDSLDWERVRNADVNEIAKAIRERGMNNVLAQRIKDFLNRLVKDHGNINLEWLRNVPPDKAKEYLLSIRGLGLKSVECVRLLTLRHLAFPVDTNVGRVSVRLGWVPLQPLPESLQLHLLELYPMIEHIQKYLWPRLCTLDQQTLYELHYQMITFGKVFCTKTKPNCNACPMRGECKHFASAFASARLSLPAPEDSRLVASRISSTLEKERSRDFMSISLPKLEDRQLAKGSISNDCEPIIEEPATPEQECTQTLERDIEDAFYEDPEEIPTIKLNSEEFVKNLENYMQGNQVEMQDGDISNALVTITADTASLPMPKLKNVSRLRTEHQVYELSDLHPLLEGMDKRVPDDPCPYLLAIWAAGETSQSIEPPQSCRRPQDSAILCDGKTCFACNSAREAQAQTVRGTILIPCRTAMRGSFPLNGTYFQVNEVFADHSSSRVPIDVPRKWIWNLPRRIVFFGTSVSTIFKGLTMEGIQQCFWRGFVCVRGFDRASRVPRPLYARLHFPPSKAVQNKKMPTKEE